MKKIILICFILNTFLMGISSVRATSLELPDDTWIGVKDVLAAPAEFDGKIITIKGWATIQREFYGIWASQEDYENRKWRNCIALLNIYPDNKKNKELNQSYVLITGTFIRDSAHTKDGQVIIRLGACNEAGIQFGEPDGLRKFIP